MKSVRLSAAVSTLLVLSAVPAHGQRLLDEWQVRSSAGADALIRGATAVFWNPAQVVVVQGRGEAAVLDLRAPGATGVDGLALAGAYVLDGRTTLAAGYEHMNVSGAERTTTSPDGGSPIDIGEHRVAAAASHTVNERIRVGALVRYTRLPEIAAAESVLALGAGVSYQPLARLPLHVALMGATEGDEAYWMGGLEIAAAGLVRDVLLRGEWGVADGQRAPGITHRAAVTGEWRQLADLSLGAVSEPGAEGRTVKPVAGASLRLHRYRLGMVREELPNEFGGAYSFRFSVSF